MLPAFASVSDVQDRLDDPEIPEARVQAALDDVSALIRSEADKTWVESNVLDVALPDIIVTITLRATIRMLANPEERTSETVGNTSSTFGEAKLSAVESQMIRRAAAVPALWTQGVTRGLLETSLLADDVTYLAVDPPGDPIPWDAGF